MSAGGAWTFLRPGLLLVGVLVPFAVKQAWVFLAADFTRGSLFTVLSHLPLGETPETKSFTFKELDSLFVLADFLFCNMCSGCVFCCSTGMALETRCLSACSF